MLGGNHSYRAQRHDSGSESFSEPIQKEQDGWCRFYLTNKITNNYNEAYLTL